MSNPTEKPMHLRARMDRGGGKLLGGVTILIGIALVAKLNIGDVVGGLFLVYAGLVLFPATRVFVTRGVLGFTKRRAGVARVVWLIVSTIGLLLAYPY